MSDDINLLNVLKEHRDHITSVRHWNTYAKEQDLPSAAALIRKFDSWNDLKKKLDLGAKTKKYSKEELLSIARDHSSYFTTYQVWNKYASKNGLPVSATFLSKFETWNTVKVALELPISSKSWRKYTKDEIKEIILANQDQFDKKEHWNEYAKNHNLPVYHTIRNYFTWEEVQKLASAKKNKFHTEQELLTIAREHSDAFTTMKKWDIYAKENGLPSSLTFYRKFNSWNSVKAKIYQ